MKRASAPVLALVCALVWLLAGEELVWRGHGGAGARPLAGRAARRLREPVAPLVAQLLWDALVLL